MRMLEVTESMKIGFLVLETPAAGMRVRLLTAALTAHSASRLLTLLHRDHLKCTFVTLLGLLALTGRLGS